MRTNAQELMMNMKTAGMKVTNQAFLFLAVLISQTVMPINASAANSWLEAPKVFQKTLQAETGLPSASVRLMSIKMAGVPPTISVEKIRPNQPFQPVSSWMM